MSSGKSVSIRAFTTVIALFAALSCRRLAEQLDGSAGTDAMTSEGHDAHVAPPHDAGDEPCDAFRVRYQECGGTILDWTCTLGRTPDPCVLNCIDVASCSSVLSYPAQENQTIGLPACLELCRTKYFCADGTTDTTVGGGFIEPWDVCDGLPTCQTGVDERDTECSKVTTGYLCHGGSTRVPRRDVCNDAPDCPEGDDEVLCPLRPKYPPIPPDPAPMWLGFLCLDGNGVVARASVCDQIADCDDFSDESTLAGCGER